LHDVEAAVGEVEGVRVADDEVDAVEVGHEVEGVLGALERGDPTGSDKLGKVGGDRAGPAAHIEKRHPRAQVRQQVRGGVGRGAPAMRAQDGLVVAVGVDVHTFKVDR